jgi:hypothetical protein
MNTAQVRTEARIENKDDYLTIKIEPLTKVHLYSPVAGFEPTATSGTFTFSQLSPFLY